MVDIDAVKRRFESLLPAVDERMRHLIAAAESLAIDYGGISIVSRATGVSRRAIARGIVEWSLRCAGLARACANWPRNWAGWSARQSPFGGGVAARVRL